MKWRSRDEGKVNMTRKEDFRGRALEGLQGVDDDGTARDTDNRDKKGTRRRP